MKHKADEFLATRASLLQRLRNWCDQSSWQDFFNVYWKLIYGVARKAGLQDAEAQDVVQETLISVAKHIPSFRYDPSIGSFKSWLLVMTRWRIIAHLRKRGPSHAQNLSGPPTGTATTDRIADPNGNAIEAAWEAEWEANLLRAAIDAVKQRIEPQKFQIFDFYVNKEWQPDKVAERFGVSVGQVYQIKHRVVEQIKAEVERLEKETT